MLGAHDLNPRWLRLHKRAPTSTSTRRQTTSAAAATASTAAPVVATTSPTSFGRSGAAATGSDATQVAATTPPPNTAVSSSVPMRSFATTFAAENSDYHPNASGATSALVAGASAGSSSADSSTGTGAKPVLSQTALIGIIAGGGALLLILIATVACCCWKRKKAKKDEAQWWKLNESQASVGGAVGAGTAMKTVGKESAPSRSVAGGGGGEKDWGSSFSDEKAGTGRRFDSSSNPSGHQSFASREASNLHSAREELFAAPISRSGSPSNHHRPLQPQPQHQPPQRGPNPFLSRDDSSPSLHSQYPPSRLSPSPAPSQAHAERSLYSYPSTSTTAVPQLSNTPSRPSRPSEIPSAVAAPKPSYWQDERVDRRDTQDRNQQLESRFREVMTGAVGRPNSDAVKEEDEREQKQKRQSMLRRKKDTLMNFTDAYGQADDEGETDWDHTPSPAADTALIPPQRSSSKRTAGQPLPSATPPMPTSPGDSYFPPSSPAESASFPPQSRSAFAYENTTRRQPRYSSRVDSKPLRELEDILDSFADDPRRTQPPLPADESSLRSASIHSAMSSASPLQDRAAPASGMVPSPSSSSSLFAPGVPYGNYALNHHHNSFHSSAGDIGNTSPVKSRSGAPLSSPPLSTLSSSSDLATDHPLAAPSRHIFNPSMSSSVLSSADEASSPVVATTQMVRKISIKKDNDAPVRLTRNASLQHHQHYQPRQQQPGASRTADLATSAERDLYSQMLFDGSPQSSDGVPSVSNSPTTTPTTPSSFSPRVDSHQQRHKDPVVVGDQHGFAPLSSHNLDVSYRSATLSIYGLYDDDDAPNDLKGLPMSDPRVSRHLSGLYPEQAAR